MVNLSFINNGETSTSLNEINNNNIYIFFKILQKRLYVITERTDAYVVPEQNIIKFRLCRIQFRNFDKQMKCDNIIVFLCKKLSL